MTSNDFEKTLRSQSKCDGKENSCDFYMHRKRMEDTEKERVCQTCAEIILISVRGKLCQS